MQVYLAGDTGAWRYLDRHTDYLTPAKAKDLNVLMSFYYALKGSDPQNIRLIPCFKNFMLDSGAFSFMQGNGGALNFDEYIEQYAEFIKLHSVKRFFELDIDSVVGYEKVKEYRRKLERLAGAQCIPVWHKSRGRDEFLRMCDEYQYVSIGGIVSKEIKPQEHKYFPWFIAEAHRRGIKIHGLGYVDMKGIGKYHFDSVDATNWMSGSRFGVIYQFNGKTLLHGRRPEGTRVKPDRVSIHNFIEWQKFIKYAETHL